MDDLLHPGRELMGPMEALAWVALFNIVVGVVYVVYRAIPPHVPIRPGMWLAYVTTTIVVYARLYYRVVSGTGPSYGGAAIQATVGVVLAIAIATVAVDKRRHRQIERQEWEAKLRAARGEQPLPINLTPRRRVTDWPHDDTGPS